MTEALVHEKTHLFDRVYEVLWDKIGTGEIAPGDRLKDSEWAERLQISRTPVREAMRKMQHDGILLPLTNGGYQVRKLRDSDIVDLYRCRAALEAVATEDACDAATAGDIAALRKTIDDCDAAIERGEMRVAFELNSRFHAQLLGISRNVYVKQACDSLRRMILFYRSSVLKKSEKDAHQGAAYIARLKVKQLHHREIAAAIVARDAAKAAKLMQQHVRETAADLSPKAFDEVAE